MTHDGEEIYYADFKKGLVVWNSKIPTTVHVPHAYKIALHYRMVCRGELARYKPDKSATTKTKGKWYLTCWYVTFTVNLWWRYCIHLAMFYLVSLTKVKTIESALYCVRATRNHHIPQRWSDRRWREYPHLLHQSFLPSLHQHKVDQEWYRANSGRSFRQMHKQSWWNISCFLLPKLCPYGRRHLRLHCGTCVAGEASDQVLGWGQKRLI